MATEVGGFVNSLATARRPRLTGAVDCQPGRRHVHLTLPKRIDPQERLSAGDAIVGPLDRIPVAIPGRHCPT
jgi:hypothetical protein